MLSDTDGNSNTFVGYQAGTSNTASHNTFIGTFSGVYNTTGSYNTFIGYVSGNANISGNYNTFMGDYAGNANTNGGYNTFMGDYAGYSNTTGGSNTFIGNYAGYSNQIGTGNVFLGYAAGYSETGSNKLYISNSNATTPLIYGDFVSGIVNINGTVTATNLAGNGSGLTNVNASAVIGTVASATNAIHATTATTATTVTNGVYTTGSYGDPVWITSLAASKITGTVANATNAVSCTNSAQIGTNTANYIPRWNGSQLVSGIISDDGSTASVNGTLSVTSLLSVSDERYKKNIEPLQQSLHKVTHLTGVSYEWKTEEYSGRGFKEGRQIGLIAQEVEKVLPELVLADGNGYKAVAYDKLVPVLIEAVKEQQKEIKEKEMQYERSLNDKDARIEKLEKALEKMERRMVALESPSKTFALK